MLSCFSEAEVLTVRFTGALLCRASASAMTTLPFGISAPFSPIVLDLGRLRLGFLGDAR